MNPQRLSRYEVRVHSSTINNPTSSPQTAKLHLLTVPPGIAMPAMREAQQMLDAIFQPA